MLRVWGRRVGATMVLGGLVYMIWLGVNLVTDPIKLATACLVGIVGYLIFIASNR